jgi:uncharacterized protein
MNGIDRDTGQTLSGNAHLAQSVADILSTPLGTRVMRRNYGSMLFDLIDQPLNAVTRALTFAATAIAIREWEPRLRLTRISFTGNFAAGRPVIDIEGERTDLPAPNNRVSLSIPIRTGGATTNGA